jgi:hypothetical protein
VADTPLHVVTSTLSRGQEPPRLAREPRILDKFLADLHRAGVVGEDRSAAVTFLAVTSRLLPKPVSIAAKGRRRSASPT